ncbi:MAG: hypothetical protein ACREER_10635, partial [Alphaproteobacteria bacterium]
PAPARGAATLDALVTDDPDRVDVAAVTPDLADNLLARWLGATEHDHDGQRWVRLPLHVRNVAEAIA